MTPPRSAGFRRPSKARAEAQNKLGVRYFIGQGIEANEALAGLLEPRKQGNRAAQENLAELYRLGRDVARDLKRAHMWRVLSLQGSPQSAALENLARDMDAGDIAEAERSASEWLVLHQSVEAMDFHFKLLH